jgi:hypothetical protein
MSTRHVFFDSDTGEVIKKIYNNSLKGISAIMSKFIDLGGIVMGDFNKIISSDGIPEEYLSNARKCFMCGSEVESGGTWAGLGEAHLVTICSKRTCQKELLCWSIDTFLSNKTNNINEVKEEYLKFVGDVYTSRQNHPNYKK